ncbi:predicted protein [Histoplasma mississippiense (nom. inval.)]|uniref:predicted protein n=1 Tax=Ajellomyces capsulatus (strain NAm1 / WU24) TaxID=2059318 RepID=UPI000157B5F4|nr:predicted protein [Histoplasma mississippiense (nom. inval.)]EDN02638.1 predicted protein [Histoplasma mississippiense (nom. inval.)]
MHHEAVILSAIDDLNAQLVPNYTVTAEKYGISRYTLSRRYRGVQTSRKEATSIHRKILTDSQENRLLFHINRLADRGFPCTPQILHNLVVEILKEPIGANWVARFCQRHKDVIKSVYLRNIDQKRKIADNSTYFKHYFDLLQEKITKYNIEPGNIYNFDEKGFLLGFIHTLKRIVSINALKSGRTIGASQDGSREFITLLASICADGTSLPPALIYQGESRDMQDTWLEDFDSKKDQVYFAASENGWSNDEYGLMWLKKIFEPHTKKKAGVDTASYIRWPLIPCNMAFINYAAQHKILLAVFPPHSTHRLQPLDVGIFGPLSKSYSKHLNERMRTGMGFVRTTKRSFWQLFDAAWKESVTSSNIISAFAAVGLHPFDPEQVLKKLAIRPCTPPDAQYRPRTPTSIIGMRKLVKQVKQRQRRISSDLNQVIRAGENLALDKEDLLIENRQLQQALNQERRRRKRGRAMGLLDSSNPSLAQFFSPAKVQSIREQMTAAEAAKKDEQARKEDAKLQHAILKEQKETDIMLQRMEREAARQAAKEQKEMDKAARAAQRQIDRELRDAKKAQEQKEKEERAAARQQSRLGGGQVRGSKNHLPNREIRPSISQRVAKSRFQSSARLPAGPPPGGPDDIATPTDLTAACSLNLPPPKISRSGRVIKPNKHLLN